MEWGTPQGTDYFKSMTPGEGTEREKPLKPLNIKARKPEDEKGVKVTEGIRQQFEPEYSEAKRRVGNKIRGKLGLKKKPELNWKKDAGISEGVVGGAIGGAIGGYAGGFGGAVKGAKIGSAVGDAAAVGAAAYGTYKVGKGVYKAGKGAANIGKRIKNKLSKPKKVNEDYGKLRQQHKELSVQADKAESAGRHNELNSIYKKQDKIKAKMQAHLSKKVNEDIDLSSIEDKQADHSKHQYPINNEIETFDKGDKDHWLTGKDGEWYIEADDVKELEKEVENFTFDKAVDMGLYDEEELTYDDFDGDALNDIEITEALSVQGRLKRRFHARRNKAKLKVARRIALRRGSTPDRLKRRATRGARLMVYKRLLRGRDRSSLPPAEKARVERMITRFQPLVNRISIKLLPQMRRNEIKRLTGRSKLKAKKSKKFRPAKAVKSASSKKTKRFKVVGKAKYKAPKRKAFKSKIKSGTPTTKKASKAYKAFSYSVG